MISCGLTVTCRTLGLPSVFSLQSNGGQLLIWCLVLGSVPLRVALSANSWPKYIKRMAEGEVGLASQSTLQVSLWFAAVPDHDETYPLSSLSK